MPIPAPNSDATIERLNSLLQSTPHYLSRDDLRVRVIEKLGRDLLRSNAVDGYIVLTGLGSLVGDLEAVLENADKASRLSGSVVVHQARSAALGNLGYFSEAATALKPALCAQVLPLPRVGRSAIASGLISTMDACLGDAGNMPTAIPSDMAALVHNAAAILKRYSITDEDVAHWLDQAGAILRDQRLFYLGDPILFATAEERFYQVDMSFSIDVDADAAAALNLELAERCFEQHVSTPDCFSFGFRSRRRFNERIAA